MTPDDYSFVAQAESTPIAGDERADGFVLLSIRGHDESATRYFNQIWHKMSQSVSNFHQLIGEKDKAPDWAAWSPHKWCTEVRGVEDRQKYVAWWGDVLAGFLYLRPNFPSAHRPNQAVMYVENIATAPGNQNTKLWRRQLKLVGMALLAYAVYQSKTQGFRGSLGLHASDDNVVTYYRDYLPTLLGSDLFLPEKQNIQGPAPRGEAFRSQWYFETTEDGAESLLESYRHD
jgi:hypothetical protein